MKTHELKFEQGGESVSESNAIDKKLCDVRVQQNFICTSLYGQKMPTLVSEIQKNRHRFQKLPIGPLGMEVKVKENVPMKYVEVIETELANILSAFLVDNDQDKRVLDCLTKTVGIHINIYASKYLERQV